MESHDLFTPCRLYSRRVLTVWAIAYALVLGLPWLVLNTEFVPIIGAVWEILFYVCAFFYPCVLLPYFVYETWQRSASVKRHVKILKTLGLLLCLIPIGYVSTIVGFVVSFGKAFNISIARVACSGSPDIFYVKESAMWMDDDGGSVNEHFTLYRRNFVILEPIARKAIHTRGDEGYENTKVDPKLPSTVIELVPLEGSASSIKYSYAPVHKILRCH